MTPPLRLIAAVAFATLLASPVLLAASAEPYRVGDRMESFTLKDQHEREAIIQPANLKVVIISFEMSSGRKANGWFAKQPPSFLADQAAVLINNILGMPGVGRVFALPKLRRYPHRILLADGEGVLDRFPAVDGRLTVIRLGAAGVITAIEQVDPGADLAPFFAAP
jgi:hypothetical protein